MELTHEQIKNLTPEQIELSETDPEKFEEIMAEQEKDKTKADDKPKQEEQDGVTNDPGEDDGEGENGKDEEEAEDDPIVLNKSGKGAIPYSAHKGLRVENATLKEQLQANEARLQELQKALEERKDAKGNDKATEKADEKIDKLSRQLDNLKQDMPELHEVITAVVDGSRKQGEKLEAALEELKREKEQAKAAEEKTVREQVAEAKDNNSDLVHWEVNDPEAWDEALKQDEILRTNSKWTNKPYAERFDEVVRRVRAVMPEASAPKKAADPEKLKADAKAKLDAAPVRKPTTLSDIQGGANPASEQERLENLSPFELTQKLMKMPPHQSAALRAELE